MRLEGAVFLPHVIEAGSQYIAKGHSLHAVTVLALDAESYFVSGEGSRICRPDSRPMLLALSEDLAVPAPRSGRRHVLRKGGRCHPHRRGNPHWGRRPRSRSFPFIYAPKIASLSRIGISKGRFLCKIFVATEAVCPSSLAYPWTTSIHLSACDMDCIRRRLPESQFQCEGSIEPKTS